MNRTILMIAGGLLVLSPIMAIALNPAGFVNCFSASYQADAPTSGQAKTVADEDFVQLARLAGAKQWGLINEGFFNDPYFGVPNVEAGQKWLENAAMAAGAKNQEEIIRFIKIALDEEGEETKTCKKLLSEL